MAKNTPRTTVEVKADIMEEILRFNKAIVDPTIEENINAISEARVNLPDYIKEYASSAKYEKLKALSETDNPMLNAIIDGEYTVLREVDNKDEDTGLVESKDVAEQKKRIDLLDLDRFCKYKASAEKGWQYKVEKFNQLMCFKAGKELKVKDSEMKRMTKTYYMSKLASEIEMGKTPTSNTQALKTLQEVIDSIIFKDDGNGKNVYKALSHDISFIDKTYVSLGASTLTARVSNPTTMRKIITRVLYRILTNGNYELDYKKIKE